MRVIGQFDVVSDRGGTKTVSGQYTIFLYKDWNLDNGKSAYLKPLTKLDSPLRGLGIPVPVGPFGALPGRGEAREFIHTGRKI